MKKTRVKIGGFVILFVYAIILYTQFDQQKNCDWSAVSILSIINNSISAFIPSRVDPIHSAKIDSIYPGTPVNGWLRFHCNLLFLLVSIYVYLLVVAWFGRKMMNHAQFFFSRKEKWFLFLGSGEQSILLAKDIIKHEPKTGCIFIIPEKAKDDKDLFDLLDELGAVVLYADFEKETASYARKRISNKVTRYFFLDEDQDFNVKTALLIANKTECGKEKVHLHIRTEIERIDNFFKKFENIVELHFFNQSDLTARQFVEGHPMLDSHGINIDHNKLHVIGEFNLLLLGFGWTGQELLKKCICDSQFVGSTFRATILDKDYETRYGDYSISHNECIEAYNLDFNPCGTINEVGSLAFFQWLNENILNNHLLRRWIY